MQTITVTPRNEEEYNLVMETLRRLNIKIDLQKKARPTLNLPRTPEECRESVRRGHEDYLAGRVITHEELKKRIAAWR